jgi:hypothetical protein
MKSHHIDTNWSFIASPCYAFLRPESQKRGEWRVVVIVDTELVVAGSDRKALGNYKDVVPAEREEVRKKRS